MYIRGGEANTTVTTARGVPYKFIDTLGIPRTKDEMDWAIKYNYVIEPFREAIDVDLMLDYVDLALDWYIPSIESIKFINFIRLCIGKEPENLNDKTQYFFIDCLLQQDSVKPYFTVRNIDYDFLKGSTVILATREFSKSVLLMYLMLYMASTGELVGFGKVSYVLYVSDKMEGNVLTTMNTIKGLYNSSVYLKSLFEEVKLTDKYVTFYRKPRTTKEISIYNNHIKNGGTYKTVPLRQDRKVTFKGIGVLGGGRGLRDELQRPDGVIFDDLVRQDKDVSSEVTMEGIETTIEKDIRGALSGNGNFKVLIGTAYAEHDPVYKRASTASSWLPIVFPRAERPPHDGKYAKDGTVIEEPITKENFISVWSDRHSYEKQRNEYKLIKADFDAGITMPMTAYMQEFFVRISSNDDRLIPEEFIRWYDVEMIKNNVDNYTFVATSDFTTTGSATSDDSALFIFAIDKNDNWYLVSLTLRKMDLDTQYDNVFEKLKAIDDLSPTTSVILGVEVDAQQSLHVVALKSMFNEKGYYIRFAKQKSTNGKPVTHVGIRSSSSGNKFWRFKRTVPRWKNGKIFLPNHLRYTKDMRTFLKELKLVTNERIKGTDNGLDAISQLEMIDYILPTKQEFNESYGNIFDNYIHTGVDEYNYYNDGSMYDNYV